MKRTVIVAAGVVALGLAIIATHRLAAQNTVAPQSAAPAPTTKVALINLTYVLKNYKKTETFTAGCKAAVKPFQDRDTTIRTEGEKLAKEGQDGKTTPERRDQIEKRLIVLKRESEDNKVDAEKALGKKREEQIRILYMDIHKVVERYAQSHGYDMVLHFADALTSQDYWSAQNIQRKLQGGFLMPLYYSGALDISGHVVATLNSSFGAPAMTTTTPPATAPKR